MRSPVFLTALLPTPVGKARGKPPASRVFPQGKGEEANRAPKLRPTMQCQVGLYFLSNSFLMKAAISFSMLYFSRAWKERKRARLHTRTKHKTADFFSSRPRLAPRPEHRERAAGATEEDGRLQGNIAADARRPTGLLVERGVGGPKKGA